MIRTSGGSCGKGRGPGLRRDDKSTMYNADNVKLMKLLIERLVLTFCFGILLLNPVFCQNPARFQEEINKIKSDQADYSSKKNLVLFTGSSSVRMWTDVQTDFPDLAVLNTGFGGSTMSDLLYYADTVILRYRPVMLFIYEGDNDIASGKKPDEILRDAGKLVDLIRQKLPRSRICFISAKPSIARWNQKEAYLDYNRQLKEFTANHSRVYYLDVWDRMLGSDGNPKSDIFLDDRLHMNRTGYDIWKEIASEFLMKHKVRGKA